MGRYLDLAKENMEYVQRDQQREREHPDRQAQWTQQAIAYALIALTQEMIEQRVGAILAEPVTYCDACDTQQQPGETGWQHVGPLNQMLCPSCLAKYLGMKES